MTYLLFLFFLLDKCILFIYLIKLFFTLLHLNGCSFPGGNSKNMNNYPFQNKIIIIILILTKEWQLVSPAKQLCVTTKKMFLPTRHTDRQTPDKCAAMPLRRHKNHNTWKKNDCSSDLCILRVPQEFIQCQRIVYIYIYMVIFFRLAGNTAINFTRILTRPTPGTCDVSEV